MASSDHTININVVLIRLQEESQSERQQTALGFYGHIWLTALDFMIRSVPRAFRTELYELGVQARGMYVHEIGGDIGPPTPPDKLKELEKSLQNLRDRAFSSVVTSPTSLDQYAADVLRAVNSTWAAEELVDRLVAGLHEDMMLAFRHRRSVFRRKRDWNVTTEEERAALSQERLYLGQLNALLRLKERLLFLGDDAVDLDCLSSLYGVDE